VEPRLHAPLRVGGVYAYRGRFDTANLGGFQGPRPLGAGRLTTPVGPPRPRIAPQHPLQFLGSQSPSERSPHVHLRSLDERLAEALVQASAAGRIGSGDVPLWIAHDDEGSAKPSRSR